MRTTIATDGEVRLTTWATAASRAVHDVRSPYVERCWLALLGPSCLLLLRQGARLLDGAPEGLDVDIAEVARTLGLGGRSGDAGPLRRTVERAVDFQVARVSEPRSLALRRNLPEPTERQLRRVPPTARAAHAALRIGAGAPVDAANLHARRLAASLAGLGASSAEIEEQLRHWRYEEPVASAAATWAARHPARPATAGAGSAVGATDR